MVGVLLTLVAIGLVSYFVIKNYYPPIIQVGRIRN